MPLVNPLKVTLNHAQKRMKYDRQWVTAKGDDWLGNDGIAIYGEDVWLDPICHRLMLQPAPLYDAWWTSNAGIYAKLALADFDLQTAAKWKQVEAIASGQGYWLEGSDSPGYAITKVAMPRNRGVVLSWFGYGEGSNFKQFSAGWNSTASHAGGNANRVTFDVFISGDIHIYRGGVLLWKKNISGVAMGQDTTSKRVALMIIPIARRELLFVSSEGNGFSVLFEDLSETDVDPTIVPNEKFFVDSPEAQCEFQLATLSYASSGWALSRRLSFADDPSPNIAAGNTATGRFWYDWSDNNWVHAAPTFTLASPTNGVFVEADRVCRLGVNLAGDGTYTPVIYGAEAYYAAVSGLTNGDEEFDLTPYITEYTLEVPEDPAGVAFTMTIKEPETVEAAGAYGLLTGQNLPCKIEFGSVVVMDGRTEPAEYEVSIGDDLQKATIKVRDPFKTLEQYLFQDYLVHDNSVTDSGELSRRAGFVARRCGYDDTDCIVEATSLIIGATPSRDANEFNYVVEAKTTAADELRQLVEDQAAGYRSRFMPYAGKDRPPYVFTSPSTMDTEDAATTLYVTREEALADGVAAADVWLQLARSLKIEHLEPEANDIHVTGWDPRTGLPIEVKKTDAPSLDIGVLPSTRAANWVGEWRRAGVVNRKITTQSLAEDVAIYLYNRYSPQTLGREAECEMLFKIDGSPVWASDRLQISINTVISTYRVAALRVRGGKEPNALYPGGDDTHWREASYVLSDGSGNFSGGCTLSSIKHANRMRAAKGNWVIVRPGSEFLTRLMPPEVTIL